MKKTTLLMAMLFLAATSFAQTANTPPKPKDPVVALAQGVSATTVQYTWGGVQFFKVIIWAFAVTFGGGKK